MTVQANYKEVANLLKIIVNNQCKKGEEWFPDVKHANMSVWDLSRAIQVLENAKDEPLTVLEK